MNEWKNHARRYGLLPLASLMLVLFLAACGNGGGVEPAAPGANKGSNAPSIEGTAAAFPRTIHHDKGDTVLSESPKKIAVTYFPYADHLFAIGRGDLVTGAVGLQSLQNFPVYDEFTKNGQIADLGNDAPDLEKLLALDPDVIIAWENDEKIYDQLSKIAPTILIHQSENWQDTIGKIAEVAGEEEKAQAYIDAYNQKLEELAAGMKESGVKGKTAMFMMTWNKGFNYYGGVRMEPYYNKLGFSRFPGMKDWGEISLEGVGEADPDYIFLCKDFTGSAELTLEKLQHEAVWKQLKAVKNNHVYVVDTEIVGPLAMGQSKGLDVIGNLSLK